MRRPAPAARLCCRRGSGGPPSGCWPAPAGDPCGSPFFVGLLGFSTRTEPGYDMSTTIPAARISRSPSSGGRGGCRARTGARRGDAARSRAGPQAADREGRCRGAGPLRCAAADPRAGGPGQPLTPGFTPPTFRLRRCRGGPLHTEATATKGRGPRPEPRSRRGGAGGVDAGDRLFAVPRRNSPSRDRPFAVRSFFIAWGIRWRCSPRVLTGSRSGWHWLSCCQNLIPILRRRGLARGHRNLPAWTGVHRPDRGLSASLWTTRLHIAERSGSNGRTRPPREAIFGGADRVAPRSLIDLPHSFVLGFSVSALSLAARPLIFAKSRPRPVGAGLHRHLFLFPGLLVLGQAKGDPPMVRRPSPSPEGLCTAPPPRAVRHHHEHGSWRARPGAAGRRDRRSDLPGDIGPSGAATQVEGRWPCPRAPCPFDAADATRATGSYLAPGAPPAAGEPALLTPRHTGRHALNLRGRPPAHAHRAFVPAPPRRPATSRPTAHALGRTRQPRFGGADAPLSPQGSRIRPRHLVAVRVVCPSLGVQRRSHWHAGPGGGAQSAGRESAALALDRVFRGTAHLSTPPGAGPRCCEQTAAGPRGQLRQMGVDTVPCPPVGTTTVRSRRGRSGSASPCRQSSTLPFCGPPVGGPAACGAQGGWPRRG